MKKMFLNPLALDKQTIALLSTDQLQGIVGGNNDHASGNSTGCGTGGSNCTINGCSTGCPGGGSCCYTQFHSD